MFILTIQINYSFNKTSKSKESETTVWLDLIHFLFLVIGHHRAYFASTILVKVVVDTILYFAVYAIEPLQVKINTHVTESGERVQRLLLSN